MKAKQVRKFLNERDFLGRYKISDETEVVTPSLRNPQGAVTQMGQIRMVVGPDGEDHVLIIPVPMMEWM